MVVVIVDVTHGERGGSSSVGYIASVVSMVDATTDESATATRWVVTLWRVRYFQLSPIKCVIITEKCFLWFENFRSLSDLMDSVTG